MSNHLTCDSHKRRVQVVNGKTIHRNDGSKCNSPMVKMFDRLLAPIQVGFSEWFIS
jgi:hypothetical protein